MEQIYGLAKFIAVGAAWGILWLAGIGLIKKSLSNAGLLKLLIYIFMITAGITAIVIFKGLYTEYSGADAATKELILSRFKGKDGWLLILKLAVVASPILFLIKPIKSFKILVTLVAACYVSIPYHQKIFEIVTK